MRTSIIFPIMPKDPEQLAPFAGLVRDGRAHRLWQGQSLAAETHQTFAFLAGMGLRVPVGTSVTLMPLRHPLEAAVQARSLARITGRDVVLGVGPGSADLVALLRGAPYPSPRTACLEYVRTLRALLGGDDADPGADVPACAAALPRLDHPRVEVGLGVLRPVLARAAGMAADAAITWMTPPGYLDAVLAPALAAGARETGRATPRLVTVVHVALDRPGRNPYRIAYDAARDHLSAPHYTDMLKRAGLRVHPSQPGMGARALVDSGTFAYGTPGEVAGRLAEYARAGVDEVVLNPIGVGTSHGHEAALEDLREILAAVHDDSPSLAG